MSAKNRRKNKLSAKFSGAKQATIIPDKKPPATRQLMTDTAVDLLSDMLMEMGDPDVVLKKLQLPRSTLRNLESDDEISGAMDTRREALITTPWRLEGDDQLIIDFVHDQITPHVDGTLRGAFDAIGFGYSVQEIIYKKLDGGFSGLKSVSIKPFEWFTPNNNGELIYHQNDAAGTMTNGQVGTIVDTTFKFLLTQKQATYKNPFGEALYSRLYWPWFFRHQMWRFWMQYLERFGSPFMLGKGNDPNALAESLSQAYHNAVIAVGADDEVEVVSPSKGGADFEKVETALVKRMQKRILGQTLTTDVSEGGSYAAAKIHEGVRQDKRHADIRLCVNTVQTLVNALTYINFPGRPPPIYVMEDGKDLQPERAERDEKLYNIGVRFNEKYFKRTYDINDDEFVLAQEQIPVPGNMSSRLFAKNKQNLITKFSNDKPKLSVNQQQIESLGDAVIDDVPSPIDPEKIREIVKTSKNKEEFIDSLLLLLDEQPVNDFEELFERSMFAADVIGFNHATTIDDENDLTNANA